MGDFKKNIEKFYPLLEDLRARLYRGLILSAVAFAGGFLFTGIILKNLLKFMHFGEVVITTSSPFQFTGVAMDIGFSFAIMVFVPYTIYSLYDFAAPALTKKEKIKFFKSLPIVALLFIAGFLYGFFILYYALGILAGINTNLGIANFWNIGEFLAELLITSALLGVVFEFPLLLTLLIKLRIIEPPLLKRNRKIAYFFILVLVSLLPPTDYVSLIAMALPLLLLYEGTILLNSGRKKLFTEPIVNNI
jgi:sec-independent protein translocase protein TatC